MALTPGTLLGPYEILDHIGSGGMGDVYRARDSRLNRMVAIKQTKPADADRFAAEARAIAAQAALDAIRAEHLARNEGGGSGGATGLGSRSGGALVGVDGTSVERSAHQAGRAQIEWGPWRHGLAAAWAAIRRHTGISKKPLGRLHYRRIWAVLTRKPPPPFRSSGSDTDRHRAQLVLKIEPVGIVRLTTMIGTVLCPWSGPQLVGGGH